MNYSELRRAENEAVFKQRNETVKDMAKALQIGATRNDMELHFTCECSNERCHDAITLTVQEYEISRLSKQTFIVIPGHEDLAIERVIDRGDYSIVEKFEEPPPTDGILNQTH